MGVTVHTTGFNWDGILANAASILIIVGTFAALLSRTVKHSIKDEIRSVIRKDVTPLLEAIEGRLLDHDTRLARLEGIEEGKRQVTAEAGLHKG